MRASAIEPRRHYVNGRRVTGRNLGIAAGGQIVTLRLDDGTTVTYRAGYDVPGVTGRVDIPAGPTPSDAWFVSAPPKMRANHGRWRGEIGNRRDMIIATHACFALDRA